MTYKSEFRFQPEEDKYSYFRELQSKAKSEEEDPSRIVQFLENIFPWTKQFEGNYSDTLNYTPADTQDLMQKFLSKENSGLGFQKTVTKDYTDFNGKGPGRLYITDKKGVPTFNFYPTPPPEWVEKNAKALAQSEFAANFFIHIAPLVSPFAMKTQPTYRVRADGSKHKITEGGKTLLQQRRNNNYIRRYENEGKKIEWLKKNNPGFLDPKAGNVNNAQSAVNNVYNKSPIDVRAIVTIAKKNKISYKQAEAYLEMLRTGVKPNMDIKPGSSMTQQLKESKDDNLSRGYREGGILDPKRDDTTKFQFTSSANYKSIQGPDKDSGRLPWSTTRAYISHFDVTNHRVFEVPGMNTETQTKRYKDWLTTNLINRHKKQQIDPTLNIKRWSSVNNDFIDSQGKAWRLVRANKKTGSGPDQEFIPTPLSEVDSRLMKKQNTSMEEKVILHKLLQTEVKDRNKFEKKFPWMRDWISEQTGENYHEHMFGLDETEFWKSGYGKSLGYMNNDVYNVEKGLGNIVFLRDARFKKMKDAVADYITPGKKREVWPGFKVRKGTVKVFTGGPYKGLNAIIGYDANPTSKTYTDLTIYAYNPSPDVNFGVRVATMPNYYSIVFARDSNGKRILSDESAQLFVNQYIDAVLKGNQPKIIALTDLARILAKQYPYLVKPGSDFELPAPSGLNLDIDYRTAGAYSIKAPDPDPLDLKTFKTTPALQRKFDKAWKRKLLIIQKGRYTQLDLIDLLFLEGD
tara:strand:+ start:60 stop:2288 length:2229 start_codon:yes stop_codon:yes gene_type:complete